MSKRKTYSTTEYAAAWGVTPRTVYRWVAAGSVVEGKDYVINPAGAFRFYVTAMPKGIR